MSEADQMQALLLAHYQAHEAEAKAVPETRWKQPKLEIGEYIKETRSIVEYGRSIWETGPNGAPPLNHGESKFPLSKMDRLSEILNGLHHVNVLEISAAHPVPDVGPKVARALVIIEELDDTLSFVLDDDIEEAADDTLEAIQKSTKAAGIRGASVGQVLWAWGLFAKDEYNRLSTLKGFELSLIDEAITLGTALCAAKPASPARLTELRSLRLGFYTLAHTEVQALRQSTNYVYRRHPDIKKKFTSTLERNRRNQNRLTQKLAEVTQVTP